jgi:MoaA/NifB/PqqE/SkfB family radical SAM enzyme
MPGFLPKLAAKMAAKYYLRKPDREELVLVKYPTNRALLNGALNEVYYRLGSKRGYRLVAANFEVTDHCNLRCAMCPVNRGMRRKKGFMEFSLFKKIIDETPTLEFLLAFQWGEPLLHRDFYKMIRYAHDRGIRTMVTSNGTLLNDEVNEKLIDCGLTRITFSIDGVGETHTRIRGYPYEKLKDQILRFKEARDKAGGYPKIEANMTVSEENEGDVEAFYAEWEPVLDRVQAITVFTTDNRRTKCRELWRGLLVVLWDGRVSVCCADYEGDLIVGDACTEKLADIWNGPKMRQIRLLHCRGTFPPVCKTCGEYESPKVSKRFS